MSDLYNKIETLCKENGISITTMCKDTGISRSSLTDLKAGRSKMLSMETLTKISEYFGISIDHFKSSNIMVEAHNQPIYIDDETREVIDELRTRPEMKILFSVSKNVTKEDIEATVEILKRMKKESE